MEVKTNENYGKLLLALRGMGAARTSASLLGNDKYEKFLSRFPAEKLESMSLDDYCVGKGGNDSFCWWLERGLEEVLGRYSPGTSRGHILYFAKNTGILYKNRRLADLSDEEALKYTLKVQACIANSTQEDVSWIDDDAQIYQKTGLTERVTVGAGRKLRLLAAYRPDIALPIASSDHLEHFLKCLGCQPREVPPKNKPVARMLLLREYFKLAKSEVVGLSTLGFIGALYSKELDFAPKKENGISDDDNVEEFDMSGENTVAKPALNQILYGPPGTGKTYATINEALRIVDPEFLKETLAGITDETLGSKKQARELLQNRFKELAEQIQFVTFHQSFSYEDFVEGIRAEPHDAGLTYPVKAGVFKQICESAASQSERSPKVLIIDEINRGNISKIFGELITLIEPSKRLGADEALKVILPYSKNSFGVPDNVYIIGTMNSADRSLASLDLALRRRFDFIEMPPDSNTLEGIKVDGVDVKTMFETINQRIEVLLGRDYCIGHAYFLPLENNRSLGLLANIFKNKIIPLLQEYFFEDWARIAQVLNSHPVNGFVVKQSFSENLFGSNAKPEAMLNTEVWRIKDKAFKVAENYRAIYEPTNQKSDGDDASKVESS